MLQLYKASGSPEIQLLDSSLPQDKWISLKQHTCHLLKIRNHELAVKLLENIDFELRFGTNFFGDEFSLLYLLAPLELYVEMDKYASDKEALRSFNIIANTMSELGQPIRFIAVEPNTKTGPDPVTTPNLAITSDLVERALADAQQLILTQGAPSAVDRVHTAFHGYLKTVCSMAGLAAHPDSGITDLFKEIQKNHPKFHIPGERNEDIIKIGNAIASILNSLNPLRNRATLAHANENLLREPEAMLVINSVRTLLHYLDAKIQSEGNF